MFIKLFGALLILISGSSIAWIMSNIYLNRVKELKDMQLALNILNTEISYGQSILPEALRQTANVINEPLSELFASSAEELKNSKKESFDEIWQRRLKRFKYKCDLLDEDLDIMKVWGQQIGCSDLNNQINVIQLTIKRLEQQEEIANEIAEKKVKIARYTGVLISLMVIILFY
ncbi:hypothetical protein [Natronospora cellulosivora (SeqCode)]